MLQDLHNHVITQTGQAFVSTFLNRCIRVYNEHQRGSTTLSIPVFALEQILPRYRHSNRRLLLLDYEDTLWLRQAHERVSAHEPPVDVVDLLKALASDEKNAVWLLSGLPIDGALTKIAENVPELGIWCVLLKLLSLKPVVDRDTVPRTDVSSRPQDRQVSG
jgi:trehalose 6-phosphate synthase complex regulatory subunit